MNIIHDSRIFGRVSIKEKQAPRRIKLCLGVKKNDIVWWIDDDENFIVHCLWSFRNVNESPFDQPLKSGFFLSFFFYSLNLKRKYETLFDYKALIFWCIASMKLHVNSVTPYICLIYVFLSLWQTNFSVLKLQLLKSRANYWWLVTSTNVLVAVPFFSWVFWQIK